MTCSFVGEAAPPLNALSAAAWGAPPPAGAGAHPGVMPNYYAGTGYAPQAPQAPPPPPGDSASNPLWGVRR